jgi:peptidoglycan/xylan/chitin deacetylase (PgdA/CDA1 family)
MRERVRTTLKWWLGRLWKTTHWQSGLGVQRVIILAYHSIGNDVYSVAPAEFDAQMGYLAEYTRVVPLDLLLSSQTYLWDRLTCAITFDDGYSSVYDVALPILRKYQLPATIYLTTGALGERNPIPSDRDPGLLPGLRMLTWPQVRELGRAGFNLGSHLVHHLDLTLLTPYEALTELKSARTYIEHSTDSECVDFAYPWGRANLSCGEYVLQTGYRSAVTSIHRDVVLNCDRMFLPRLCIRREYNLAHFRAIVIGHWDYLRFLQQARNVLRTGRVSARAC